jgi:hypothetical protein
MKSDARNSITFVVLAALALITAADALAIGDSGGCQSDRSPFLKAVVRGSAKEVETEIDRYVDYQEKNISWVRSAMFKLSTQEHRRWRLEVATRYVRIGPCSSTFKPLDYAVRAGNLETTKYLIDSGADPTGKDYKYAEEGPAQATLFTRCEFPLQTGIEQTAELKARQLQAYSVAIDRGGDINLVVPYGVRAMDVCKDPELLDLLRKKGGKRVQD